MISVENQPIDPWSISLGHIRLYHTAYTALSRIAYRPTTLPTRPNNLGQRSISYISARGVETCVSRLASHSLKQRCSCSVHSPHFLRIVNPHES